MPARIQDLPLAERAVVYDATFNELTALSPLELLTAQLQDSSSFHLRVCRDVACAQTDAAKQLGDFKAASEYGQLAGSFLLSIAARAQQ